MKLYRFIPAIGWFFLSLFLLCLPGSNIPKYPWLAQIYADKLVHFVLFFVLCFLFCHSFKISLQTTVERKKWFRIILVCCIIYGTAMEFVQKFWIPNRSFEIGDIIVDSLGAFAAFLYSVRKFS